MENQFRRISYPICPLSDIYKFQFFYRYNFIIDTYIMADCFLIGKNTVNKTLTLNNTALLCYFYMSNHR